MKKNNSSKTKSEILRTMAEERAELKSTQESAGKEEHETLKLLHELEVHQIELKMQNEELLVAKENAEFLTRKYTELFDFAPSGYFTMDKEGKVAELNLYAANMLGKERSKLKNSLFGFFISNITKNTFNTFLENIFQGKVNESCEVMFLPLNQAPIYAHLTGILSENKEQCLITATNISDRKKKEEEIKKSEERYRGLLNILDAGVVVHGADTSIKLNNIRASDLLGLSEDQLRGKLVIDPEWHFIDENCLPIVPAQYPVSIIKKTKEPLKKVVLGILRPDKLDITWVVVNGYPVFDQNKEILEMVICFTDITERITNEIVLKQLNTTLELHSKELLDSNAELEKFANIASHDLQEPLRMVSSFLGLIEKKYGGLLDDTGKKYIAFAIDGAKRMRQMILDLLEYSRIGKPEDKKEDLNLNVLMDEIKMLLQKKIEEKSASFDIAPLPTIHSFKSPIMQVFQNLVENALKYSKPDLPPHITISSTELKDHWQFSISDNGIGIKEEYYSKIFVIFQRLHTKEEIPGSGLGLAVAKKIVENLGGKIWVLSEEGKGSTFHFTILKK